MKVVLIICRHGKSEKSSASRFAFSNFRLGDIPNFLDFSASTARLLDTFSMSDNLIRWGGVFWHNTFAELLLWSEFSEMIRFRTFLKKAAQIASEFAEEV